MNSNACINKEDSSLEFIIGYELHYLINVGLYLITGNKENMSLS